MENLYDPVKESLEDFRNTYVMSPELWGKFDISDLDVDFSKWNTVKMMDDGGKLNEEISVIPTAYGGIYVFVIIPPVIPDCGAYIMYVGMASKTKNENLRARVRSYQQEFSNNNREKLHRLFSKWGQYIYVYFLPVDLPKEDIQELEDRLIASLVPPCNPQIRIKSVKQAVKAFM